MMLKFTLTSGKTIYIRISAILSVYEGYFANSPDVVTYIQVGYTTHMVKESLHDVIKFLE